jgi:PAS domain S-box-containing protein
MLLFHRGAHGLFVASEKVSRNDFKEYNNSLKLEDRFPGIQGIGFSKIIRPEDKEKHIADFREEGFTGYYIRPEGIRDIYSSIIYLEPFSGRNLRAFGYDMFSEPIRNLAMSLARDSAKTTISGKVELVQETDKNKQSGFLMYIPLYKNNNVNPSFEERQKNIIGWVYAPFRMNDLMNGLFGEFSNDLEVIIYDGDSIAQNNIMYDSHKVVYNQQSHVFRSIKKLNLAGHFWTIEIFSMPSMINRMDETRPLFSLFIGIGISVLLTFVFFLIVTAETRAIALAAKNENKYRLLLHQANDSIILINESKHIVEANSSALKYFGYTDDEFIGMHIDKLKLPEDHSFTLDIFEKIKIDGPQKFETIDVNKKGELLSSEISASYVNYGEDKYILAFVRDIADRKNAENHINKLLNEQKIILDTVSAGISFVKNRKIEWANTTHDKIFGYNFGETFGMETSVFYANREGYDKMLEIGYPELRKGKLFTIEIEMKRKDNTKLWCLVSGHLVDIQIPDEGSIWMIQDISDRKRNEDFINSQNLKLKELNATKDKFFSIIAHDLRAPFNGFLGFTQILVEDMNKLALSDIKKFANSLNDSAKNLFSLLENLLTWSKVQRGSIDFNPEYLSMLSIFLDIIKINKSVTDRKNIQIKVKMNNDISIFADKQLISSVVRNLLSNAIKFSLKGGKIEVGAILKQYNNDLKDEYIEVFIKDEGIGMNKDILSKLFKIDEVVSRKGTDNEPSTGLGLILSKEFIDKHNGKIWAESTEGLGTTFKFTIPVRNIIEN